MSRFCLVVVLISFSYLIYAQELELHSNQVVARVYGNNEGDLFDWQYLIGDELVELWSEDGFNGHKVYVNSIDDGTLEWRVSGWKSSFDGGLAHGSVNRQGLSILETLASHYVLILEGTSDNVKQAYFASRPPVDVAYEYYSANGIVFFNVSDSRLERLDDRDVVYRLDFEGPRIKTR